MIASSGLTSQLTNITECRICFEVLENPKDLACGHTFCKDCLDRLLKFNEDGSCHITCPNRCRDKTYIDANSTTNDLTTSYIVKNLLDTLYAESTSNKTAQSSIDVLEKKQPLNKCSLKLDCMNEGSLYCRRCNMVFCFNCELNHKREIHADYSGYITVSKTPYYLTLKNDRKDGKTKIICVEHNTVAEYYCVGDNITITLGNKWECDKPICLYCKERKHRSHDMKTIEAQVEINKNEINEFKKDINIEILNQNLKTSYPETEKIIASIRLAIQKEIKYRKAQQLAEYLQKLDKGEVDLIQRYDQVAQKQLEKLSSCEKHIPDKKDFEILVNKEEIILEMNHLRDPIPKLSVWLSDTSLEFPLGKITKKKIEQIDFSARPSTCSIVDRPAGYSNAETVKEETRYLENLDKLSQAIQRERSGGEPDIESKDESETKR